MLKRNAIALALSSLSAMGGCSSMWFAEPANGPVPPALPARAGAVEGVLAVRDSRGVDSEGMYRIGRQFQGQARFDEAIVAYRKALQLNPANVDARNALAVAYAAKGQARDAEIEFKAAIAIAPARSHLHSNLGYHYLQLGRTEEAIAALAEALRHDPANARARSNMAAASALAALKVPQVPVEPLARPDGPATEAAAVAARQTASPVQPDARSALLPVEQAQPPVQQARPPAVAEVAPLPISTAFATPVRAKVNLIGEVSQTGAAALVAIMPNVWELRPSLAHTSAAPPVAARNLAVPGVQAYPVDAAHRIARLEVANGNGVEGLARRVGEYLQTLGVAAPRLTNQRPFDQRRTVIQYVAGQARAAEDLKLTLGSPADLVATARIDRNAQVRVVLGRDFTENEFVAAMRHAPLKRIVVAAGAPAR